MSSVAVKIAVMVALVAFFAGGFGALLGIAPFSFILVMTAAVFGATWLTVHLQVLKKLRRIDVVFDELRIESGRSPAPAGRGDELDALTRKSDQTLHSVRRRLADSDRTDDYRREYIGDVSHELKTPIFAIQGFAETLLGGALADPAVNRSFVEKILQNAGRLSGLARDLSEISRLERGEIIIVPRPFSLAQLTAEVIGTLELLAGEEGIDIRLQIASDADMVEADRDRIRQVLSNLIENAVKYNRRDGWVLVSAERSGRKVGVSVRDSGIGIPAVEIPRVTERFFRTEKSRSRPRGGSGLGLSIVKHILAAHGTTLHIESEIDRGSSFSFSLRAAQA